MTDTLRVKKGRYLIADKGKVYVIEHIKSDDELTQGWHVLPARLQGRTWVPAQPPTSEGMPMKRFAVREAKMRLAS